MNTRLSLFILLVTPCALFAQDDASTSDRDDRLNLARYLDWESVSNPRFSPDGSQVLYSRSWTDKVNDRRPSQLWIMNRDGSKQRFLTEGSAARWSPDGARIAFTRNGEPKGSQIHVLDLDDRSTTQITHLTESPSNLRWAPDGRSIAFNMQVAEKQGFEIKLPSRPKGADWAEEPTIITRLNYRRDRRGYRPSGYRHIFTVDATGSATTVCLSAWRFRLKPT